MNYSNKTRSEKMQSFLKFGDFLTELDPTLLDKLSMAEATDLHYEIITLIEAKEAAKIEAKEAAAKLEIELAEIEVIIETKEAKKAAVITELEKTELSNHQLNYLEKYDYIKTTLSATKAAITKDLNDSIKWLKEVQTHKNEGHNYLHGEKTVYLLNEASISLRQIEGIANRIKKLK